MLHLEPFDAAHLPPCRGLSALTPASDWVVTCPGHTALVSAHRRSVVVLDATVDTSVSKSTTESLSQFARHTALPVPVAYDDVDVLLHQRAEPIVSLQFLHHPESASLFFAVSHADGRVFIFKWLHSSARWMPLVRFHIKCYENNVASVTMVLKKSHLNRFTASLSWIERSTTLSRVCTGALSFENKNAASTVSSLFCPTCLHATEVSQSACLTCWSSHVPLQSVRSILYHSSSSIAHLDAGFISQFPLSRAVSCRFHNASILNLILFDQPIEFDSHHLHGSSHDIGMVIIPKSSQFFPLPRVPCAEAVHWWILNHNNEILLLLQHDASSQFSIFSLSFEADLPKWSHKVTLVSDLSPDSTKSLRCVFTMQSFVMLIFDLQLQLFSLQSGHVLQTLDLPAELRASVPIVAFEFLSCIAVTSPQSSCLLKFSPQFVTQNQLENGSERWQVLKSLQKSNHNLPLPLHYDCQCMLDPIPPTPFHDVALEHPALKLIFALHMKQYQNQALSVWSLVRIMSDFFNDASFLNFILAPHSSTSSTTNSATVDDFGLKPKPASISTLSKHSIGHLSSRVTRLAASSWSTFTSLNICLLPVLHRVRTLLISLQHHAHDRFLLPQLSISYLLANVDASLGLIANQSASNTLALSVFSAIQHPRYHAQLVLLQQLHDSTSIAPGEWLNATSHVHRSASVPAMTPRRQPKELQKHIAAFSPLQKSNTFHQRADLSAQFSWPFPAFVVSEQTQLPSLALLELCSGTMSALMHQLMLTSLKIPIPPPLSDFESSWSSFSELLSKAAIPIQVLFRTVVIKSTNTFRSSYRLIGSAYFEHLMRLVFVHSPQALPTILDRLLTVTHKPAAVQRQPSLQKVATSSPAQNAAIDSLSCLKLNSADFLALGFKQLCPLLSALICHPIEPQRVNDDHSISASVLSLLPALDLNSIDSDNSWNLHTVCQIECTVWLMIVSKQYDEAVRFRLKLCDWYDRQHMPEHSRQCLLAAILLILRHSPPQSMSRSSLSNCLLKHLLAQQQQEWHLSVLQSNLFRELAPSFCAFDLFRSHSSQHSDPVPTGQSIKTLKAELLRLI